MSSENFSKVQNGKIPVAILGATGMVGQKFVELLSDHPWFHIVALAGSERSVGKTYAEATEWRMDQPLKREFACLKVTRCMPQLPCQLVFSGLNGTVSEEIEANFARAGYCVISNAHTHRMRSDVPLIIPEINSDHLDLVKNQPYYPGMVITNPNCSVIGLAMALKPLVEKWGVTKCHVVTLQASSGAGYPGVPSLDLIDNVIPFIIGEERKIEQEPLKIFGCRTPSGVQFYPMEISAQCNRVAVSDGHMACMSVKLKKRCEAEELIEAWQSFIGIPQSLKLPSAPRHPLTYHPDERHPQPKLHRALGDGMSVSIGRLQKCPLFDWKFVILSHNTVRGAAGCAVLNAELAIKKGLLTS